MDRVQASEAWGRGFESHAAHQFQKIQLLSLFVFAMQLICKQFQRGFMRL